jgi:hypothetical protein
MVGTVAIPDVKFCNLVIFVSQAVILVLQPLMDDIAIAPVAKLTVPLLQVKPFEAVNNPLLVIVFDVNNPEFEIDPDDKPLVHVIEFDVKLPELIIFTLFKFPITSKLFKFD